MRSRPLGLLALMGALQLLSACGPSAREDKKDYCVVCTDEVRAEVCRDALSYCRSDEECDVDAFIEDTVPQICDVDSR